MGCASHQSTFVHRLKVHGFLKVVAEIVKKFFLIYGTHERESKPTQSGREILCDEVMEMKDVPLVSPKPLCDWPWRKAPLGKAQQKEGHQRGSVCPV